MLFIPGVTPSLHGARLVPRLMIVLIASATNERKQRRRPIKGSNKGRRAKNLLQCSLQKFKTLFCGKVAFGPLTVALVQIKNGVRENSVIEVVHSIQTQQTVAELRLLLVVKKCKMYAPRLLKLA